MPKSAYPGEVHTVNWSPIVNWGEETTAIKNRYRLEYRYKDTDEYKLLTYIEKEKTSYESYVDVNKNILRIQYRVRAENLAGYTEWAESLPVTIEKDSRFKALSSGVHTIPVDGVYHLAIRGGRGGSGGSRHECSSGSSGKNYSGGAGGEGIISGGLFTLKKGDKIKVVLGGSGSTGRDSTASCGWNGGVSGGGTGGGESNITLNGVKILSSRGGSGGSGGGSGGQGGSSGNGANYVSPVGESNVVGIGISSGQSAIKLVSKTE